VKAAEARGHRGQPPELQASARVAAGSRARLDAGRLVMVPAATLILLFDAATLVHRGAPDVLAWLGTVLVCAFYLLTIWCYLRRGPAIATSRSVTAHLAALAATWAPFTLPLLHGSSPGAAQQAVADALLVIGMTWSVWSLRFLGRNVSVLAQARAVVDAGPYRWVRHPLYTGEIVAGLGLAISASSLAAAAVWLAIVALQVYRAMREEQVLLRALPGYAGYRARTAALLPGVF
jgi:protein-S-isoprenylcysteine O-methyltransferase Ste14